VSRLLEGCGHEVLVANARKVRLIYGDKRKNDKLDAENLARLARLDPKLLYPLKHRDENSQAHLALIRSREALVGSRTQLINHVRGAVKSFGARLPKCSARSFHKKKKVAEHLPKELTPALGPLLETIGELTERIREYERKLEEIAKEHYPETGILRQVGGVGALTALSFVLILEDPSRLKKSRAVGAYLGLVPGEDRSGESDPQRRISKEGDEMLRRLMVSSAHYILGPFAHDFGSEAPRAEDRRTRWQERQETSGGGGRPQALRAVA
jgi:transposase